MGITAVRITDTTLRDGDHAVAHQFRVEDVRKVAQGLDDVGISVIEVAHGDGLGGSSIQYGVPLHPEEDYIRAAAEVIRKGQLAVLLIPGIGTRKDLTRVAAWGVRVVRVEPEAANTFTQINASLLGTARA